MPCGGRASQPGEESVELGAQRGQVGRPRSTERLELGDRKQDGLGRVVLGDDDRPAGNHGLEQRPETCLGFRGRHRQRRALRHTTILPMMTRYCGRFGHFYHASCTPTLPLTPFNRSSSALVAPLRR